jgi:hypothetical protein
MAHRKQGEQGPHRGYHVPEDMRYGYHVEDLALGLHLSALFEDSGGRSPLGDDQMQCLLAVKAGWLK